MTNVIPFRGGQMPAPAPTIENLIVDLRTCELEIARTQLSQIRSEIRHANAYWILYCLKRALVWGFFLWLLILFAGGAKADSVNRSFYNGNGSFAGSSVTRGKSTSFYNSNGSFAGTSIRHGNQTSNL
jgi:hypothetical protein